MPRRRAKTRTILTEEGAEALEMTSSGAPEQSGGSLHQEPEEITGTVQMSGAILPTPAQPHQEDGASQQSTEPSNRNSPASETLAQESKQSKLGWKKLFGSIVADPGGHGSIALLEYAQRCDEAEEHILGDRLEKAAKQIQPFTLKHELYLPLALVEHHCQEGRWTVQRSAITSFSSLIEVLSLKPPATIRHQTLILNYSSLFLDSMDSFLQSLGTIRRAVLTTGAEEKWLSVRNALLAMVALSWNIRPKHFVLLETISQHAKLSFDIILPSKGQQNQRPQSESESESCERFQVLQKCALPNRFGKSWQYRLSSPHMQPPTHGYAAIFPVQASLFIPDDGDLQTYNRRIIASSDANFLISDARIQQNSTQKIALYDFPNFKFAIPLRNSQRRKLEEIKQELQSDGNICDEFIRMQLISQFNNLLAKDLGTIGFFIWEQQFECRRHPNYARANYLLHLRDSLNGMRSNLDMYENTLSTIRESYPDDDRSYEWMVTTKRDIKYLRKSIFEREKEIEKLEKLMETQIAAQRSYWETLLAIIAAGYIPLTFATSIFGMNIYEISQYEPRWWTVVAIGVPLVFFTILVPLVSDSIVRIALQAWSSRPFQILIILVGIYSYILAVIAFLWIRIFPSVSVIGISPPFLYFCVKAWKNIKGVRRNSTDAWIYGILALSTIGIGISAIFGSEGIALTACLTLLLMVQPIVLFIRGRYRDRN